MKEPIILYSSSGCLRCRLIKLMLESHNVEYIEVKDNKQLMIERGFESAPVLEIDGKVIDDYGNILAWLEDNNYYSL